MACQWLAAALLHLQMTCEPVGQILQSLCEALHPPGQELLQPVRALLLLFESSMQLPQGFDVFLARLGLVHVQGLQDGSQSLAEFVDGLFDCVALSAACRTGLAQLGHQQRQQWPRVLLSVARAWQHAIRRTPALPGGVWSL